MVLKRQEKEIPHHNTKVIKACLRLQETCHPWNSGKQPVAITCCGGAQRRQKQASGLISHPAFSKSILPRKAVSRSGEAMPSPAMCLTTESVLRPHTPCSPVPGIPHSKVRGCQPLSLMNICFRHFEGQLILLFCFSLYLVLKPGQSFLLGSAQRETIPSPSAFFSIYCFSSFLNHPRATSRSRFTMALRQSVGT